MDELLLRELTPAVIGVLVRRGVDFATAEDAVQEALIQAALTWPDRPPTDPKGWLVAVAWRKFLDAHRSETSRRERERRVEVEPPPGPAESADDTLQVFFLCAHPSLTEASAVALTLRAVGGLTTRQIAQAYLVPEATMAQRISRAKRTVGGLRFEQPGDLATVLRVLYLIFNEGYTGDVDLAVEAIRLTRQLSSMTDDEEIAGLLALMLLHHARRPARTRRDGQLIRAAYQRLTRSPALQRRNEDDSQTVRCCRPRRPCCTAPVARGSRAGIPESSGQAGCALSRRQRHRQHRTHRRQGPAG